MVIFNSHTAPVQPTTGHHLSQISGGGGCPDPRFTMYMYLCIGVFGKSAQKILVEKNLAPT